MSNGALVRTAKFLKEFSLFLLVGAITALLWANIDHHSYHEFQHTHLVTVMGVDITVHFLVNDILMAVFFAIAAKEVWEALLPGGKLSGFRRAATPLMATLGGIVVPASIYVAAVVAMSENPKELYSGWGITVATDIAFAVLIARLVFGSGHPAIAFLLLLAIADDAGGLGILAVFYPQGDLQPLWLLLAAVAVGVGVIFHHVFRLHSFWWYLLVPGVMSWVAFYKAGVHPALGLVPVIPTMPHAKTDLGIFVQQEYGLKDTLNQFEHWWSHPVEIVLCLFGLVNAGVTFSQMGPVTLYVTAGLVLGKPLGVFLFTWVAVKFFGLELPGGLKMKDIAVIGMIAGVGFTVALFMSLAAFPAGPLQDAAKMGALFSFGSAALAFPCAVLLGVGRFRSSSRVDELAPSIVPITEPQKVEVM